MLRRTFLTAIAGVIAAPAVVRAQSKKFDGIVLNINGYGGDYDRLLNEYVAKPLRERTGLQVKYQPGQASAAVAKLIASKDNPPFDLIMADSPNMPDIIANDLVEKATEAEVKNIAKLKPSVREFGDYGVPYLTNAIVLACNSKYVKQPLSSYNDLARADLKGKLALISPENTGGLLTLLGIGAATGGDVNNLAPAFSFLNSIKANVATISPATTNLAQLYQQEEVWAGPFWDGRTYSIRQGGTPLTTILPKEGVFGLLNYVSPVKNSKNREAALAYIDQALSDEAVGPMVEFFRYSPVTKISVSDAVGKDLVFKGDTLDGFKKVDWEKVAKSRSLWSEEFNKAMR
ncbi:extracellular solute-binding protein [Bradyrhizobium liaoningense]|uniref:extracellular solute-binding protein n=1 Tax=Bradyrhizobium liaoningense TaxID=43992 RepID=UPI001BA6BC43|nr:extracellular solute-binding protein [Bradyrhizobium liaoningense]MBR0740098.1 extracellular solute-binding protein [Bradyrhizobium liaoningense]